MIVTTFTRLERKRTGTAIIKGCSPCSKQRKLPEIPPAGSYIGSAFSNPNTTKSVTFCSSSPAILWITTIVTERSTAALCATFTVLPEGKSICYASSSPPSRTYAHTYAYPPSRTATFTFALFPSSTRHRFLTWKTRLCRSQRRTGFKWIRMANFSYYVSLLLIELLLNKLLKVL